MKVTDKMTLKEYNQIAHEKWPIKVPDITSQDLRKKLGDCLYFSFNESNTEANQRAGVHDLSNVKTDLGGEHVLISDEFYYFGANPIAMPDHDGLHDILHQTQGHKRQANNAYKEAFKKWLFSLGYQNGQHGWPAMNLDWSNNNGGCGNACSTRLAIAKEDEKFERLSKC